MKKYYFSLVISTLFLTIVGCAVQPTNTDSDAVVRQVSIAMQNYVNKQQYREAAAVADPYLSRLGPTAEKLRESFRSDPYLNKGLEDFLKISATSITEANQCALFVQKLKDRIESKLINTGVAMQINDAFNERVGNGNNNNDIPFIVTDDLTVAPSLSTPKARLTIFKRSLGVAASQTDIKSHQLIDEIFRWATNAGPDSEAFALLKNALPNLKAKLTRTQLANEVAEIFPDFAATTLAMMVTVPQHIWKELGVEQRDALNQRYIIDVIDWNDYGTIIDVQSIDESTLGTTFGSRLGAAYGTAAYVDNAFSGPPKNWNYSATGQITAGLLGGVLGSLLDKKAEPRFHTRYTIRSGAGIIKYVDEYKATSFRNSIGFCMSINPFETIELDTCSQTKEQFLTRHSTVFDSQSINPSNVNSSLIVYCKFTTVVIPVQLPNSVCIAAGGAVLR